MNLTRSGRPPVLALCTYFLLSCKWIGLRSSAVTWQVIGARFAIFLSLMITFAASLCATTPQLCRISTDPASGPDRAQDSACTEFNEHRRWGGSRYALLACRDRAFLRV